ncbi:MAG: ABC transporter permease [Bacteroidia bacterium]|nr:ABC transporter permease [Bacteroidia bacterium]
MYKIFVAFVKKEFYHILRDRRTLIILFGIPIALVLIFGYTVTNEFKGASIAILDQAHDELSREYMLHLQASGHFEIVGNAYSYEEIEESFKSGEVKMTIVIPPDFGQDFYRGEKTKVQFLADASEPNYASTLINYASQMTRKFQMEKRGNQKRPFQINIESRMIYNPRLESAYNFIPGVVALILMLISAMMTSLTIAREKELGTMDLLLVSPLPPLIIILGKVTPYIILSFLNALMILAMGYFVFDVPIYGNVFLLMGLCILYLTTALALGVLISTKAPTQQAAMMGSLFSLMLPTMLLSGFLFPISSMPALLQAISTIIPATYFIEILKAIMLKGVGMEVIWFPTIILFLMTFFLLGVAWKNFEVVSK